ncbi:hypothetical protein Plec18167_001862 [Paecilomyces lecythidis]|uniref:Uncharacterized protein n=1 Tax=Paecilomyces lecythidis TaxID=3004212 RepID=A0ABR3YA73_9EURO
MDSDKPQASTAQGDEDLFQGVPVHVRLPFLGPSANAWAQQKEKERQQKMQQQSSHHKDGKENKPLQHQQSSFNDAVAIPLVGPTMPASQTPRLRYSGLDYDEELALPMPKPRTRSKPAPHPPIPILMQPPAKRGMKGKDRAVTDPGNTTGPETVIPIPEIPVEDKRVTEKKSRVAALKSKFSFKDPANKDSSKSNTHNAKKETGDQAKSSFDSEKASSSMDEPKLYVPKEKEPGVSPSSAPPTSVQDRFSDPSNAAEEQRIRAVRSTPAAADSLGQRSRRASVGSTANEIHHSKHMRPQGKIEGIVMGDPSLSPTRSGTYAKSGTPEVVASQSRIVSMQAELETHRQASGGSSSSRVQTFEPPMEVLYSPSVYGVAGGGAWEQLQHAHPDTMPMFSPGHRTVEQNGAEALRRASDMSIPPTVPTAHDSGVHNPASSQGYSASLVISTPEPTPVRHTTASQQSQYVDASPEDIALFSGVTSHGGYAPPPPDPEYQSTANLEQQLWTHVSTLHHHMNSMTNRITKVIGDTNSWHMDQVLRNVDNLGDVARILTTRAVGHTQIADETKHLLTEVRGEIQALRKEASIADRRLVETVNNMHKEIVPLRLKVDALYREFMSRPSVETKGNQRVDRVPSADEISARLSNMSAASQKTRARSDTRPSKANESSATAGECPSDVPTPTAAFRTPNQAGSTVGEDTDQTVKGYTGKKPQGVSEASTGSPERKAASLCSQSDHASVSSALAGQDDPPPGEKENTAGGEKKKKKNKSGRKKSVYGFANHRDGEQSRYPKTPKHNRVTGQNLHHASSAVGTQSPHIPQTPSSVSLESSAGSISHLSPSLIHPALRTPRQQEIMRQREQLNRAQQRARPPYRRNQQPMQHGYQNHHQSQIVSPMFGPNAAASNAYMSYPPMLNSPTVPPTPGYIPPPPPPMPPRNAPGPQYGPHPQPVWESGALVPAPSGSEPWGPSHWYQEAYGGERVGSNQPYQK